MRPAHAHWPDFFSIIPYYYYYLMFICVVLSFFFLFFRNAAMQNAECQMLIRSKPASFALLRLPFAHTFRIWASFLSCQSAVWCLVTGVWSRDFFIRPFAVPVTLDSSRPLSLSASFALFSESRTRDTHRVHSLLSLARITATLHLQS